MSNLYSRINAARKKRSRSTIATSTRKASKVKRLLDDSRRGVRGQWDVAAKNPGETGYAPIGGFTAFHEAYEFATHYAELKVPGSTVRIRDNNGVETPFYYRYEHMPRKNPITAIRRNPSEGQHFWMQTQAPAGNWVDSIGTDDKAAAVRYAKHHIEKMNEQARVVDRFDTVIWSHGGPKRIRKNPAFKGKGRGGRRVAKKATQERSDAHGKHVRLYSTDIVSLNPDGSVTLRSGGWMTVTTKRRMNEVFEAWGIPLSVETHKGSWMVVPIIAGVPQRHKAIPFNDGVTIDADVARDGIRRNPGKVATRKQYAVQMKTPAGRWVVFQNRFKTTAAAIAYAKQMHKATRCPMQVVPLG